MASRARCCLLWTGDWILCMSVLSPPMGGVLVFLASLVIYGLPGSQCNEWTARLWSTWLTTRLPAHQHRKPWLSCSKQLIQDLITEKKKKKRWSLKVSISSCRGRRHCASSQGGGNPLAIMKESTAGFLIGTQHWLISLITILWVSEKSSKLYRI